MDGGSSDVAAAVADRSEGRVSVIPAVVIDAETRQVPGVAKESCGLSREPKALGIERPFVLAHIRLVEAREAETKIEDGSGRESVRVIVAKSIVSPSEEIPCWPYPIDHTGPTVARLYAIVVREAE